MITKEKKSESSSVKRELIEIPEFSHEAIKDKLKVIFRSGHNLPGTVNHINVVQPLFADITKFYWEGDNNRYLIIDSVNLGKLLSRIITMFSIYRTYSFVFEINIPMSEYSMYFDTAGRQRGGPVLEIFEQPFMFNDQLYEYCPYKH